MDPVKDSRRITLAIDDRSYFPKLIFDEKTKNISLGVFTNNIKEKESNKPIVDEIIE